MAQLVVRNLEDVVKEGLRERAIAHGRSLEEEVRVILRTAVLADGSRVRSDSEYAAPAALDNPEEGVADRIAKLFKGRGIDFDIPEIEEMIRPAIFDE